MNAAVQGKRGKAWGISCPKAGLGALPGVGFSVGAVLRNISRQFVSNSQALFGSSAVQMPFES